MRFEKSRNVSRWITFYEKYLKRKVRTYENIRLWVGKSPRKAEVNIGIKIVNPTIDEFNALYRAVHSVVKEA